VASTLLSAVPEEDTIESVRVARIAESMGPTSAPLSSTSTWDFGSRSDVLSQGPARAASNASSKAWVDHSVLAFVVFVKRDSDSKVAARVRGFT
jgi:hypothetical protein